MKKINLSDIKKQDPFVVPEGYLESLPQLIQERVQQQPNLSWSQSWNILLLPRLQLAFALLAVIITAALIIFKTPDAQPQAAHAILEEASQQEILTYLSTNNNLSMQELAIESNWDDDAFNTVDFASEEALENEVLQQIDTYTAEDLWK